MNPILAEKLSLQILNQLPEFLRADPGDPTSGGDYQKFIAFLQAYYEFMEQDGEAQYVIQNARSYADIDDTIDLFVEKFLEEFAYDLPGSIFINQSTNTTFTGIDEYESKRAVAKKISQAYSAKGSEAAVKLLFRLLFDDEVTFYYPKEDVLRASDGLWVEKQTLKVYDSTGNVDLGGMEGHIITGDSSGATAVIDEIFNPGEEYSGLNVYEYKLERGTINGTFTGNETITFSTGNLTTGNIEVMGSGTLLNVVAGITIVDPGYGYSVNTPISVSGTGSSFSGKVSAVNDGGKIKAITFANFGANYTTLSNATILLPSTIKNGKFDLEANVITAVLTDATGNVINHGLKANDSINVSFTSGLANTYNSNYTIISVPSIKKIRFGLANSATVTGNLSINSRQATLAPIPGALCNYDGVYMGVLGQPDNQIVIQDSYYYQDYSYVIRTTKESQYWKDIVKKVLHPAGMELFPEVYISTAADTDVVYAGIVDWQTYIALIKFIIDQASARPINIIPRTLFEVSIYNRASRDGQYAIGSTLNTIEQFKFAYENLAIYDVGNVTINTFPSYTPSLIAPPSLVTTSLPSLSFLFANSEPGVWYDPSDMTTLFQDAAGTTPVTAVEQAVGLMLDKSRGLALGPNIAPTAFSGYNATVSNGGVFPCVVTSTVNNNFGVVASSLLTVGKYYEFVISWVGNTNGKTLRISDGSNTGAFSNAVSGTLTNRIVAGFASIYAYIVSAAIGETFTITSITTKEITGIHATSLTTSRPVLTARVNLLTKTEQFDDAAWASGGALNIAGTISNTVIAPDGTLSADKIIPNTTSGTHRISQVPTVIATTYCFSVFAKLGEYTSIALQMYDNAAGTTRALSSFNLLTGIATSTTGTASITPVGNGWYRCTVISSAVHSAGGTQCWIYPNTQSAYSGDGTSGIYIWGASLTTADQASLGYQRVNTATDYDTVGFPMWLKADGVDDYMVTGTLAAPVNLNMSSTDKVTVATGVRKLSDAALGMLTELGAGLSTQIFYIAAPRNASTGDYEFRSAGTSSAIATTTNSYAAPITNVLSGLGNISGDLATLRVNGTQVAQSTADQGTGNFGTYPLYQFRRGGTTLPFNGLSAGLTVVGRTLTADELSKVELYYQRKTQAY